MPAPPARIGERDLVRLSQLYAKHAKVTNERGERYETRTWSEIDVAQWQLGQPRARAWFTVPVERLGDRVRERTVAEMIDAAEAAGAPVRRDEDDVTVETVAGVTTTLGGLAIDEHARVAGDVYACGADAGGIATGGYASGLAAALVLGRIAARAALGERAGRPERPRPARAASGPAALRPRIASGRARRSRSGSRRSCCSSTGTRCRSRMSPTGCSSGSSFRASGSTTRRSSRRSRFAPSRPSRCARPSRRCTRAAAPCSTPGATIMSAGLHPDAALFDVELVQSERYERVEEQMRG